MNQSEIQNKGTMGEQLVAQFFDSKFSRYFSFPNPKTKDNVQVADVLVWWNKVVFLIEVKTRDEDKGTVPIEYWIRDKIKYSVENQILENYKRIKNKEIINLHNSYYQTSLDCEGIASIIGIVVLIYEKSCSFLPTYAINDIYEKEVPIHVLSWKDLA